MAQKVEAQGGSKGGKHWDDGSKHDGVTKIHVQIGRIGIQHIMFDYIVNGQQIKGPFHAFGRNRVYTFEINHPNEYLVAVEGTYYDHIGVIQSLRFKTNKRTSQLFGYDVDDGTSFTIEAKNKKIVGFHGYSHNDLHSLGAYFVPISSSSSFPLKLKAQGGSGGDPWDDGAYDGIRKVYVGKGFSSFVYIKFEYQKGSKLVLGADHGKITRPEPETFELDYPSEYMTAVEGSYERFFGVSDPVITSLRFKTNKRTSPLFGNVFGTEFVLEQTGCKIVGFHGKSRSLLSQIGAYVLPISSNLQGKWIKLKQQGAGPGKRSSHAIAVVGEKMYSFGGEFKPNTPIDNKLYVFDLETHTWSIAPATGDIPPLNLIGVCMVSIGCILYVFGGRNADRKYSGFYSYNTLTNEWKLLTPVNEGPAARSYHSMTADDKNVYIFGGVSFKDRVKTLHAYNIWDRKWVQLPTLDDPFKARGAPGFVVVEGKVWVIYGFSGDEMDDVHFFDTVEGKWVHVETKGEKPSPRSVFATAVVGKYIVIFGGEIEMDPKAHFGPGKLTNDTFALDTETLEWKKLDDWVEGMEEERPGPRGWCAFTSARIEGHEGLLMYGGNTPTNDRVDDIFFFSTILSA